MPSNPASIFVPPLGGGPPSAPGSIFVPPAGGSPPSAPGPIFTLPVIGDAGMVISGTISPDLNGTVREVVGDLDPQTITYWCGGRVWSTDGEGAKNLLLPKWVAIYPEYLITPASATINQIFPPAQYKAVDSANANGANNSIINLSGIGFFQLVTVSGGAPMWVELEFPSDGVDRGNTVVPQGTLISGTVQLTMDIPRTFQGGLGATWAASPTQTWQWRVKAWPTSTFPSSKYFRSASPATSPLAVTSWTANGGATGTFTLTASGGAVGNPPAVYTP